LADFVVEVGDHTRGAIDADFFKRSLATRVASGAAALLRCH
jgi:hypothetical protein